MKVIFLGCTTFSEQILNSLIELNQVSIKAVFSIPKKFLISYSKEEVVNSNYADLSRYAQDLNIPFVNINSIDGQRLTDHYRLIKSLDVDVILVMGWYYMVNSKIRNLAKYGAWGIHASLLPKYAGGAPLVWAIIEGEKESGVTLFKLSDGVDDGDLIGQVRFVINESDTIKEVYEKATNSSIKILTEIFLKKRNLEFVPQDKSEIQVYPQRSPKDGEIDWSWDVNRIKNFIRAQTRPYPGAWTVVNNKKVIIWDAEVLNNDSD